ncbi:MAG: PKD domain-containing protein [Saprospiraceae bacterium]|nr:PKD domain-containing protein [Saprospiraceae bacterium]
MLCPSSAQLLAPVCGCDGIDYANECEALSSGLSQWWAGSCNSVVGSCQTKLQVEIVDGVPGDGYTAQFSNLSQGNYTFAQLDFGDGSPLWEGVNWDTVLHYYDSPGIYKVNLTVWNAGGCISSLSQLVVTDAASMTSEHMPDVTDYVVPGDVDRDLRANAYDLLNLGVGHYSSGAPRPGAHTNWVPQFAPNWDHSMQQGINYKHMDCDGNGTVNAFDADVILQHYSALDSSNMAVLPGKPALRIEFDQDTIWVNPNNPAPVEIKANVKVGSPSQPALGLYGLAFALQYPDYVSHNPDANYDDDFFGSTNHLLWLSKDLHEQTQLDIGLTRINGQAANGYGKIANITFSTDVIIIIDIIERSESQPIPFVVPVRGIKAIDKWGNKFEISAPVQQDTIWIKTIETSSGTEDDLLQSQVLLSPNPSGDISTLYTADLHVENIQVLNALGQSVHEIQPNGLNIQQIPVADWAGGVYTLRIRAEEGMVEKKLVVR